MWYSKLIFRTFFLLMLLGWSTQGWGTDKFMHQQSKRIYKSFSCNTSSSVELTNKHGNIYVNTWEKDSVAFEVTIEAYSEKSEYLEELIDMVEISFSNYSTFIIVETAKSKSQSLFDKASFGIGKLAGAREVKVNYQVYLPTTLDLSIENQFGDVFFDEFKGPISLDLSHGELRANKLSSVKSLKVRYGEVQLDQATGGRLDFGYVKSAQLGSLEDMFIKSTYSEIDIESLDVLRLESRLDEVYINELGSIKGQANLSKLHIRNLREKADLESKYGNLKIDDIAPSATELNFKGSHTDYDLGISSDVTGSFEVQLTGNKTFSADKNVFDVKTENQIDDKTVRYEGKFNDSSNGLKLLLVNKFGAVAIGG